MPEGFDTAITIEHVILSDDLATISFDAAPSKQYAGTKAAGSTMRKGDVLVNAGCVLTPLLLSAIASGGNTEAKVLARPKVAFIPTGNELVTPAAEIPRGKNIETNSLLICGKIRQWGGIPIAFDIVQDNQEAIKEAVLKACAEADIVVLNAGSSKGSDDWNVEMLDEVGTVLYHEVNHGPGHHSSGAVVNGTPVVGISGPPGGASFTTDFYLYPLMMKYLGQPTELKKVTARLAKDFPKAGPKPKTGEQPNKAKGEDRPPMVLKHEFFSIRQVALSVGEDGCLEARPSAEMHLSLQASDAMDAYFPASSMKLTPHRGDLIEVWLRA